VNNSKWQAFNNWNDGLDEVVPLNWAKKKMIGLQGG
jgi:hypothetical protein